MSNIDITDIKTKLSKYGLTLTDYQRLTGNLVGSQSVPSKLLAINPNLTIEEAFYLVCNKVFLVVNLACHDVPIRVEKNWDRLVGEAIFDKFQTAVFEEVNQRFMSNYFPEFANQNVYTPSGVSIMSMATAPTTTYDYLNPITLDTLASIDWTDINNRRLSGVVNTFDRLLTDMSNLNLAPKVDEQFLMSNPDGSFKQESSSKWPTMSKWIDLKTQIDDNMANIANNTSSINKINMSIDDLATKSWTSKQMLGVPDVEQWYCDKVYSIPQFVVDNGCLWFNNSNNNLNHKPGGNDVTLNNKSWWTKIENVISIKAGEVVYCAGTDLKISETNPNQNFYFDISLIQNLNDVNKIFNTINKLFPKLNLTINNVKYFINNFSESIANIDNVICSVLSIFQKNEIKFFSSKKEFEIFANKNFLNNQPGIDYSFLENNKYLLIGEEFETGGNNFISTQNLPTQNYQIDGITKENSIPDLRLKFDDYFYTENSGHVGNNYLSRNEFGYRDLGKQIIGSSGTDWDNDRLVYIKHYTYTSSESNTEDSTKHDHNFSISFNLNNSDQTEIKPVYQSVCAVRFLKNIFPKNLKLFVNIIDIQNYYSNTDFSYITNNYYNKQQIDDRLLTKLSVPENNEKNTILLTSGTEQVISDKKYNTNLLDKINIIKEQLETKLPYDVDNWDDVTLNKLVKRLKIRM